MRLTFLQAQYGDCIHITEQGQHVIIDGGPKAEPLLSTLKDIRKNGEHVNLLVITHYDSDHIAGVLAALKCLEKEGISSFIKEVWFNAPNAPQNSDSKELSLKEANELTSFLYDNNIKLVNNIQQGKKYPLSTTAYLQVLYGGKYIKGDVSGEPLGTVKCDWEASLKDLDKFIDDKVVDKSETNSESIVLLLKKDDHSILLPGDSTPDRLLATLLEYKKTEGNIKFDLVKLPHHGSYKNITEQILKSFTCSEYLISTSGEIYNHPDKKAILKILKWGIHDKSIILFHFNYPFLIEKLKFTEDERKEYHFNCDGTNTFEF